MKLSLIAQDLLDIIFPPCCMACDALLVKGEQHICIVCEVSLPRTNLHVTYHDALAKKFWGRVQITHALAFYYFSKYNAVQELVHNIKYQGMKDVALWLGRKYGKLLNERYAGAFDIVVPVPLHRKKLYKRGFNQSEVFARGIAEAMQLPMDCSSLVRVAQRSSQTNKRRFERWKNVELIYQVCSSLPLEGKRILLVDDVITTGATIEVCASALIAAGVKDVSVVALAVAEQ